MFRSGLFALIWNKFPLKNLRDGINLRMTAFGLDWIMDWTSFATLEPSAGNLSGRWWIVAGKPSVFDKKRSTFEQCPSCHFRLFIYFPRGSFSFFSFFSGLLKSLSAKNQTWKRNFSVSVQEGIWSFISSPVCVAIAFPKRFEAAFIKGRKGYPPVCSHHLWKFLFQNPAHSCKLICYISYIDFSPLLMFQETKDIVFIKRKMMPLWILHRFQKKTYIHFQQNRKLILTRAAEADNGKCATFSQHTCVTVRLRQSSFLIILA